jgi:hypothetical protein
MKGAIDDVAEPEVTLEQLLLHGRVDVQVDDSGFAVNPSPVKSGHC